MIPSWLGSIDWRTAKAVAQLGAVLGREFAYELMRAVAPMDDAAGCSRG